MDCEGDNEGSNSSANNSPIDKIDKLDNRDKRDKLDKMYNENNYLEGALDSLSPLKLQSKYVSDSSSLINLRNEFKVSQLGQRDRTISAISEFVEKKKSKMTKSIMNNCINVFIKQIDEMMMAKRKSSLDTLNDLIIKNKRSYSYDNIEINKVNIVQKHIKYSKLLRKKLTQSFKKENKDLVKGVTFKMEPNSKYRDYMEDFINIENIFNNSLKAHNLYVVCDGHSGYKAAKTTVEVLPATFLKYLEFNINNNINKNNNNNTNIVDISMKVEEVFKESFKQMDLILKETIGEIDKCGCTCNLIYICIENGKRVIYSGNVGDTRSILIREKEVLRLSYDHKSSDKDEQKRVKEEGGLIIRNRLFGTLAITRALGDFDFKDEVAGLSNIPYVSRNELRSDDKYCIVASDGLWDVINDEEAKNIINDHEKLDKVDLANILVSKAIELGSRDNICCVIIKIN